MRISRHRRSVGGLAGCEKSPPWPFSTKANLEKAKVFQGSQPPHPAAGDFIPGLLGACRFFSGVGGLPTGVLLAATLVGLLGGLAHTAKALGAEAVEDDPAAPVSRSRTGRVVSPIRLRDTAGKEWSLSAAEGGRATVVAFLNFNCPVSNQCVPVLNDLVDRFGTEGVTFIAVVCDAADAAEVDRLAAESKIACRVFFDPDKAAAAHFRATTTPQVFVIDRNRVLRYSGLVNNLYTSRLVRQPKADATYLADAIAAVVADQNVAIKETSPIGCPLEPAGRVIVEHGTV